MKYLSLPTKKELKSIKFWNGLLSLITAYVGFCLIVYLWYTILHRR